MTKTHHKHNSNKNNTNGDQIKSECSNRIFIWSSRLHILYLNQKKFMFNRNLNKLSRERETRNHFITLFFISLYLITDIPLAKQRPWISWMQINNGVDSVDTLYETSQLKCRWIVALFNEFIWSEAHVSWMKPIWDFHLQLSMCHVNESGGPFVLPLFSRCLRSINLVFVMTNPG